MKKLIEYTTETSFYYSNANISSNCNSITFINTGSQAVQVDGITLTTNQSIAFSGNLYEINVRTYVVNFIVNIFGETPQLVVVRKIYNGMGEENSEKEFYSGGRRLNKDTDY